jgi:hypothetical protein
MTSTRMPSHGTRANRLEDYWHGSKQQWRASGFSTGCRCVPGDYRPYVQNTAISWEIDVPTVDEMAARIDGLRATHDWLVLEQDDQIIGFAYGSHAWPPSNRRLRPVSMSTSTITAPAEDASSTRNCCAGSPSAATGKPSPASPNPTRPATAFIDPSGSRTPAHTGAWHGSTTAGTTWHGCSSICLAMAARMDLLTRSSDPPAASGPVGR